MNDKKEWKVIILNTKKEYKLSFMDFENRFIGIYTGENIRTQYGFNEVRVFHGDHEFNMNRGGSE